MNQPLQEKEHQIRCTCFAETLYIDTFDKEEDLIYLAIRQHGQRKKHLAEVVIARKDLIELLKY